MSTLSRTDALPLRDLVAGPVLHSGSPALPGEVAPFNLAAVHRPEVVVGATCTSDVVAAVGFAAARGMAVAVQATGHGAEAGVDGGVLVTTHRMRHVAIDPVARTARIAAGARWTDVMAAAARHGLSPLSGSAPGLGAVGYVLGGGLPILGRAFGFGADHVRSFEVVTADGRVRHVDAGSEPDLFWALRGGRGAFAVVTEMTVDLLPLSRVYGGAILYPGSAAAAVLHAWGDWVQTVPDEMCTSLAVKRLPDAPFVPEPLRGQCVVALRVAYVGAPEEGARLVEPLRQVAPVLEDTVADMPWAASAAIHQDPVDPVPVMHKGSMLGSLPTEAVDALLAAAGPDVPLPLAMVELRHLGGALARAPRDPNPVPGRSAAFNLTTLGALVPPIAEAVPHASGGVHAAMAPWATGECLLTFLGPADAEAQARVWPAGVYERLRRVKAAYDPADVFRHGQRIPPAAIPAPQPAGRGSLARTS